MIKSGFIFGQIMVLRYLFNVMIFYGQVVEMLGIRFLNLFKDQNGLQTNEENEFFDYGRMEEIN